MNFNMKYPAKIVADKNTPTQLKTVRTTLKDATIKVDNKATNKIGQFALKQNLNQNNKKK